MNNSFNKHAVKYCLTIPVICLPVITAMAHPINIAMERAPLDEVTWYYFRMGLTHIIPAGIDHILFVVGLCLMGKTLKNIVWQATAFTVAHSITLALSAKGIIVAPPPVVEPIIALSIVFVAVENMLFSSVQPWRIVIVFLFGLVHGMGFASALNEVGLPRNHFTTSVLCFNLGVEAGQLLIILLLYALLVFPLGRSMQYKKWVVYPLSVIIALIAGYWTIERMMM